MHSYIFLHILYQAEGSIANAKWRKLKEKQAEGNYDPLIHGELSELPPDKEVDISMIRVDDIKGVNRNADGKTASIYTSSMGHLSTAESYEALLKALTKPLNVFRNNGYGYETIRIMDLLSKDEIDNIYGDLS